MNKKKLHFYQLACIFSAITIITLLYNWGYKANMQSAMSMMGQSMGNMMRSMHLNNAKLPDLFANSQQQNINKNTNVGSNEHHKIQNNYIKKMYYLATIIIVILLPFIIAGTVFLAILWI